MKTKSNERRVLLERLRLAEADARFYRDLWRTVHDAHAASIATHAALDDARRDSATRWAADAEKRCFELRSALVIAGEEIERLRRELAEARGEARGTA